MVSLFAIVGVEVRESIAGGGLSLITGEGVVSRDVRYLARKT